MVSVHMENILDDCKSTTQMNVQIKFLLIQQDHCNTQLLPIAVTCNNIWESVPGHLTVTLMCSLGILFQI